jgi:PAS domain S-box-containing protein
VSIRAEEDALRLISRISSSLIRGAPDEVSTLIERALQDLAEFAGANRSSLFQFGGEPPRGSNTHEWCANPEDSQIAQLRGFPAVQFGHYWELLSARRSLNITKLADLPESAAGEREWVAAHGFRSLLFTPIEAAGELVGALGFYGPVGEVREWRPGTQQLLEIAGDIIYSAIAAQRANDARRESESVYRTLVETCPDGIALTAMDGTILKVNSRALEIYGVERTEDIVGLSAFDLVAPADRERARANMQRRGAGDNPGTVPYQMCRADGSRFPGELGASPVIDARGVPSGVVAIVRDVTERVQLESRLQQSSRMASLGTLVAGLAHEINNPLTYVLISMRRLERALPALTGISADDRDPLTDSAKAASHGIERIAAIVRDLRTFSHIDPAEVALCKVEQIIDDTLTLVAHQFRTRAKLVKAYGETPTIQANRGHLAQVFLNLLVNAANAIDEGDFDDNEVRIVTSADGGFVTVEIVDSGRGIPDDIRGRLFDPFFTASPTGDGTGLGLSICAGIVKAHEGSLVVESKVGVGSTFRLRLPIDATRGVAAARPSEPKASANTARRRILVVDDEPMICDAVESILSSEHDVTSVHSGRAAMATLESGRYDLVVCDLMMRDLGGADLYRWVLDHVPELAERMLFITGATAHSSLRDFIAEHRGKLLEKPFDADELRRLVSHAL